MDSYYSPRPLSAVAFEATFSEFRRKLEKLSRMEGNLAMKLWNWGHHDGVIVKRYDDRDGWFRCQTILNVDPEEYETDSDRYTFSYDVADAVLEYMEDLNKGDYIQDLMVMGMHRGHEELVRSLFEELSSFLNYIGLCLEAFPTIT